MPIVDTAAPPVTPVKPDSVGAAQPAPKPTPNTSSLPDANTLTDEELLNLANQQ